MTYQVIVTPEAQADIRQIFQFICERSPLNAARWLQNIYERIETLENHPERCGAARERQYFEEDLRQLLFKSHRAVFWINKPEKTVYVLRVRHAKQETIGAP